VPVGEQHVIEPVDRFKAQNERRVAVLFEDDAGKHRRFEAVRGADLDHTAEAAQRGATGLGVVGQDVQVGLDVRRRSQARDEAGAREA
jgi:hypothetical protein